MTFKSIALLVGIFTALGLAVGRYTAPEKVRTEIKVQKVIEKQEVVRTVTKIIERPDGTKETTTETDSDTHTSTDITRDKSKEVIVSHDYLNISILAGAQPHLFQGVSLGPIVYGASATKSLIGPVTIGAFALSDYTVGASIGLNF